MDHADLITETEGAVGPSRNVLLRECLGELATLFRDQFDRNWLYLILERSPIDASVMNDVRDLVETDVALLDPVRLERHAQALEEYVQHIRRYVVPGLREKLGISGFTGGRKLWSEDQVILRKLIAYAFPHNLERLASLAGQLRDLTGDMPVMRSA
jgi:hypothetical protein